MYEHEYFSPEVLIQIGSYSIEKGITAEIHLDTKKTFDWAKIKFTTKLLDSLSIVEGDRASIKLGYNGSLEEILTGDVTDVKDDEVIIKNDFIKLQKVKITQCFTKCTPQEVIGFILQKAGISSMELNAEPYPMRNLLSISKLTGIYALRYTEAKWDITNSNYLFKGDTFKWNVKHTQSVKYVLEYGENILDLQNICPKVWVVETISIPKLKVLDEIQVQHPKISGSFKVSSITFLVNDYGFVRTKVQFEE